jgi:hypothetical protein
MKEQFVSYEIAIKLKEKGFMEECFGFYYYDASFKKYRLVYKESSNDYLNSINAPLWQQVIDWLREKHNIDISIELGGKLKMYAVFVSGNWIYENSKDRMLYSYNEARQAAIEHALTLI